MSKQISKLAVKKDQSELLVIELKRGKASDVTVGQILRYMTLAQEELTATGQKVSGVIIASSDDPNIRAAIKHQSNIKFMKYEVNFKLAPVSF